MSIAVLQIICMDGAFASCAFSMNSRKGGYPSPSSGSCSSSWRQWRAQLVMKKTGAKLLMMTLSRVSVRLAKAVFSNALQN
ncbi:hypothetical protein DAI22_03g365000 [Oryza sativa Japonica Group]|nr:hypothetical protein DAI22_03g365000 [Oryza sativa Japonica Group]